MISESKPTADKTGSEQPPQVSVPSQQNMIESLRLLTVSDVAQIMNVSTMTVYRFVESHLIPVHRIGRVLRFKLDDVLTYLNEHRYGGKEN